MNSNKTLLHWCCIKKFWKGELTMMGGFLFFMYAFLCHLLIYCFLATNVSFLALFCDTGARFFKLFFSFASWLDARPCQQTALERHCKFGRERLFFPSALFFYMVGSGYAGALAVFLDRRMVLGSYTGGWFLSPRQKDGSWVLYRRMVLGFSSKISPMYINTLSPETEVWISALKDPFLWVSKPLHYSLFLQL